MVKPGDMNFARRRFLGAGLIAGAGVALAACGRGEAPEPAPSAEPPTPSPRPLQRGGLGYVLGGGQADLDGQRDFFLGIVNLDSTAAALTIPGVGFLGHGISPNPARPRTALVFEKYGPGCCEVDLVERRVTRRVSTVAGREFYGHGAFTPDGRTLFCTEAHVHDGSHSGVLAVRDGESLELKGADFPTHGVFPHDCLLVDDGETLVVTNGGGDYGNLDEPAGVSFVNVKTGELRRALRFREDRINAGHIAISSRGELVVVSAPRNGIASSDPRWRGAISFYTPGGELITAQDPITARMKGETLSVAIHEPTMTVAATTPAADLLTFWDFRGARLIKAYEGEFKRPRGVSLTLDGRYFAVTYDELTHLVLLDAQTLEPVADSYVDTSYIAGSHNLVYAVPA
jgi:uncharacterized protein